MSQNLAMKRIHLNVISLKRCVRARACVHAPEEREEGEGMERGAWSSHSGDDEARRVHAHMPLDTHLFASGVCYSYELQKHHLHLTSGEEAITLLGISYLEKTRDTDAP